MSDFQLHGKHQFASPGDAAVFYQRRGWEPLVLPERMKSPKGKWKDLPRLSDENLKNKFGATYNVGIALGERSGQLVDLDFDWPEAALVANVVFADLPSFGRETSKNSHRLAKCKLPKNRQFKIPPSASEVVPADRAVVLELRGSGLQTMVPPSVHPNGETVRWHDDPQSLPDLEPDDILLRAGVTAVLAVVLSKYPRVAGNRDNICLALTGALVRAGSDDETVDRWVGHVAELAGDEEATKRGGKASATRQRLESGDDVWGIPALCEHLGIDVMADTLRDWLGLRGDGRGGGGNAITLRPGFLHEAVDAAEEALIAAGVPIYQRYDTVVRAVRLTVGVDQDGVDRDSGALILQQVVGPWLREQFSRAIPWQKPTKDGYQRIDPPQDAATTYLARVGDWKVPFLQGVTQSPTLRADGTVLQTPGYDPFSALLYDPGNVGFPRIPEAPSEAEARKALDILSQPFRDFAFGSGADKSVAMAAVLTALVRPMFPSAPLFAIDAPTAGTGKSLMAETIGIIATGHKPAMLSQGANADEDQKRLSSVLMAGDQVIVIDNCDRPIHGDFLCSMLTQERVRPRVLGKSEMRTLPTRCLVVATGNNLVLSGDVTRRALTCRLDSGVERPDQRQFDFDPRAEALAFRRILVAAGLTVLRAYISAERPNPMAKIGSFEDWNVVREAIVWLGWDDPADTRERILADDPAKAILLDLLRLWWGALGERPVTLAELAALADKSGRGPEHDLITELISNTRYPSFNTKSIGRFLGKHVDRIVGGFVLLSEPDGSGAKKYQVRDVSAKSQGRPDGGTSPF